MSLRLIGSGGGGGFGEGAHVYHDATQSVPDLTETVLAFNSERHDPDGFHNTATNNSRLTVPSGLDGRYLIGVSVQWEANVSSYRSLRLRLNGSDVAGNGPVNYNRPPPEAGIPAFMQLHAEMGLASGDYIEVLAQQRAGVSLTIAASSATLLRGCEFWARRVA